MLVIDNIHLGFTVSRAINQIGLIKLFTFILINSPKVVDTITYNGL